MPFTKHGKNGNILDSEWGLGRDHKFNLDFFMYDTGLEHRKKSTLKIEICESPEYFYNYSQRHR